jgi:predicted transcriptional regulator
MAELDQISNVLGRLQEGAENAERSRQTLYRKVDELGGVVHRLAVAVERSNTALAAQALALRGDVDGMKPHVDDWRNTRNRAIGMLVGVGMLGAGSGIALWEGVAKIFRGGN